MNGYLNCNKEELVNLEYSLKRELISSNRAGGYASTTIVGCNTRKYHGLLVLPIDRFSGENHVLLSSLDETVLQHGCEFHLALHEYQDTYQPRGHKYIVDLECHPVLAMTYRVGGVILKKEILLVHNEPQLLIQYTLEDAHSETRLRVNPLLAFRNIHALCRANSVADTRYEISENGISACLYEGFPRLHMQLSKQAEFHYCPSWNYGIQYAEERARGYEFTEDLLTLGYFEFPIKKGESIVFSASTGAIKTGGLKRKFSRLKESRAPRNSFKECLEYSAAQFIVKDGKDTEIMAGFPWFGRWGRDTFISLPGLTLTSDTPDTATCRAVLDTMSSELHQGMFPNIGKAEHAAYNSADAPMWYFWAIQQYCRTLEKQDGKDAKKQIWKRYGKKMKEILSACRNRENAGLLLDDNYLVRSGLPGKALTWMDAVVDGVPVTPREGYTVEINALWYNAICFCLELADASGDRKFMSDWKSIPEITAESFVNTFWMEDKGYLADYVNGGIRNMDVRPNQIFACSLEYSPISDRIKEQVVATVRDELMTPKGIRSLSPNHPDYKGSYEGDQNTRDRAYHQGTIWPWLIGAFIEANLKLYGRQFIPVAKELIGGYEEDMLNYGISSIAEIYAGDPPHHPDGSPSQAWSVAEVLRSMQLIENYEKQDKI